MGCSSGETARSVPDLLEAIALDPGLGPIERARA
jgi:hypothetical protein